MWIAHNPGILFQNMLAIAQDAPIAHCSCGTTSHAQQAMHTHAFRQIAQAMRSLLAISSVKIEYGNIGALRAHPLDERGNPRQALDTSMYIVGVQYNKFLHAFTPFL